MISWDRCWAVERDPEKVSGDWVFVHTRVPVQALFRCHPLVARQPTGASSSRRMTTAKRFKCRPTNCP